MTTLSRGFLMVSTVLALTGCGVWQKKSVVMVDPAEAALVSAAESVASAWSRSPLRVEPETSGDASFDSDGLQGSRLAMHVDINWVGDLQPAVEALAEVAGFTARAVGLRKGPPILVAIDGVDVPLMDLLRQAGLQAGNRADVVVNEGEARIEVVYHD